MDINNRLMLYIEIRLYMEIYRDRLSELYKIDFVIFITSDSSE